MAVAQIDTKAQPTITREQLAERLNEDQEHQIDLATALGEDVPDVSKG
jgi:hypothetical protein